MTDCYPKTFGHNMRNSRSRHATVISAAVLAALLLTGQCRAADLPVKARPAPAPGRDEHGGYVA
jgi:hypothetical protein